jgi:hypothetical protein
MGKNKKKMINCLSLAFRRRYKRPSAIQGIDVLINLITVNSLPSIANCHRKDIAGRFSERKLQFETLH